MSGLGIRSFALCSFALSLFRSLLFCSFALRSFALHSFTLCSFALRSFALSLFACSLYRSSLLRSKSLIVKSDHERIDLIALYKRATMSDSLPLFLKKEGTVSKSLSSIFKKEWHDWFACDLSESLSKTSNSLKKIHSFCSFWQFFTAFPLLINAQERIAPSTICSIALF